MRFDVGSVDCGQPDCSLLTVEQPQITFHRNVRQRRVEDRDQRFSIVRSSLPAYTIHRDPEGEAIGAESHASNR
jgi:hypothetical protein